MTDREAPTLSFLQELRRRHVVRVAIVYLATAFAALQGADVLVGALELPDLVLKVAAITLLAGIPVALVIGWTYDLGSEGGITKTPESARKRGIPRPAERWITGRTVAVAGLMLLVGLGVGWLARPETEGAAKQTTTQAGAIDSIVALPAQVFAGPDEAYLADAIPSTLSTHLAQINGLDTRVPPVSHSFDGDLETAARAYRVSALLRSSIVAESDRFVLDLQLIDAASLSVLWTVQHAGRRGEYLELVRRSADDLRAYLRPGTAPVVVAEDAAATAEAELAFEKGRHAALRYLHNIDPADFDSALALLEQALELDPDRSRAASWIARLYIARWEFEEQDPMYLTRTADWARHALDLDPGNGEAYAALTFHSFYSTPPDYREALENALMAVARAPRNGFALNALGCALGVRYSIELGVYAFLEGNRNEPLFGYTAVNAAIDLWTLGRVAESMPLLRDALRVTRDFALARAVELLLLAAEGRREEARAGLDGISGDFPEIADGVRLALTLQAGDEAAAREHLERLLAVAGDPASPLHKRSAASHIAAQNVAAHGSPERLLPVLTRLADADMLPPPDWLAARISQPLSQSDPAYRVVQDRAARTRQELQTIIAAARARPGFPGFLAESTD